VLKRRTRQHRKVRRKEAMRMDHQLSADGKERGADIKKARLNWKAK
jgi:hypothetical protein